jgi:hypothetical protein
VIGPYISSAEDTNNAIGYISIYSKYWIIKINKLKVWLAWRS